MVNKLADNVAVFAWHDSNGNKLTTTTAIELH